MSSGASSLACPKRVEAVSTAIPRDCGEFVRIVRRADLGDGTLNSTRFSASGNAAGTLMARSTAPSWHGPSVRVFSDNSPPDSLSDDCPGACAVHEPSVPARRSEAVPGAYPERLPAFPGCRGAGRTSSLLSVGAFRQRLVDVSVLTLLPVAHTRRAVTVPWTVP